MFAMQGRIEGTLGNSKFVFTYRDSFSILFASDKEGTNQGKARALLYGWTWKDCSSLQMKKKRPGYQNSEQD